MVNFAYTIAGSEATGGAGFQVDLKMFQHLGVYGMGALTCIVSFDRRTTGVIVSCPWIRRLSVTRWKRL